jgi:hypothetical protein
MMRVIIDTLRGPPATNSQGDSVVSAESRGHNDAANVSPAFTEVRLGLPIRPVSDWSGRSIK